MVEQDSLSLNDDSEEIAEETEELSIHSEIEETEEASVEITAEDSEEEDDVEEEEASEEIA
jgi:hypothetical protein